MTEHRETPIDIAPVLRIVGGRLAGKEYPLATGRRVCIGHGLANDVVLRGAGTRDGAVELRLGDGAAALRVLSGTVELLGRSLGEGEEAVLPPYLPFRFGEHLVAYGTALSTRWEDAASVAISPCATPVNPLPAPRLQDRVEVMGRTYLTRITEQVSVLQVAVATSAVVLLAAAAGPASSLIEEQFGGARALEQMYDEAGYRSIDVTENPAGGLVAAGTVESEGDLIRARAIADQMSGPVMVDVTSTAALANAATDILAAQGLDAQATPAGLGGVTVAAPYLPADRQDQLREILKRDLPALKRVRFRVDDSRGGNALQSLFANSGTGLATVVEDPGHIVTADGSRWFPGSILPTGHRLVSIEPGRVRFEKGGRVEELKL